MIPVFAFTDDLVLISENTEDLQALLDTSVEYFKKVDLGLAVNKCGVCVITRRRDTWIQ